MGSTWNSSWIKEAAGGLVCILDVERGSKQPGSKFGGFMISGHIGNIWGNQPILMEGALYL